VKKCFVKVGVKSHGVDVQRGTKPRQQRESGLDAVKRFTIGEILNKSHQQLQFKRIFTASVTRLHHHWNPQVQLRDPI